MLLKRIVIILLALAPVLAAVDHNVALTGVANGPPKGPWQWTVFIKGSPEAVGHVRCVQYAIKGNFPNPYRTVCEAGARERAYGTGGTTWGPFSVSATVIFDDKTTKPLSFSWRP